MSRSTSAAAKAKALKRKRREEEEDYENLPFKLDIPDALRKKLVEEQDMVEHRKQSAPLPRHPNVAGILKEYLISISNSNPVVDQLVTDIIRVFDSALSKHLLYRVERYRYGITKEKMPDRADSLLYGAEHLLRLFVQLPVLLSKVDMDQETTDLLRTHSNAILQFLKKNAHTMFWAEYEPAQVVYVDGPAQTVELF